LFAGKNFANFAAAEILLTFKRVECQLNNGKIENETFKPQSTPKREPKAKEKRCNSIATALSILPVLIASVWITAPLPLIPK